MQRLAPFLVAVCLAAPVSAADLTGTAEASGKPVQYAVVWLDVEHPPQVFHASKVVLDQRNLAFDPPVLVIRVGTAIDFPNNDRVFHNVFSFRDGKKFDLGMYPTGTSKRIVFDRPGLSRLFCNIHPNMAAYVMAVDTPHYAMSNERGAFTIRDVPAGTYTYHAWRPGGQHVTGSVSIGAAAPLAIRW